MSLTAVSAPVPIEAVELAEYYRGWVRQTQAEQDWLHPRQRQVAERLATLKLPEQRLEAWRYTPLAPVLNQVFTPAEREEDLLTSEDIQQQRLTGDTSPRVVFLNGFFQPELSSLHVDSAVAIRSLKQALSEGYEPAFERLAALGGWQHFFAALNTAAASEGALIQVAKGAVLSQPIEIIYITYSFNSDFLAQPRLLVLLEDDAQATLVEQHIALSDTPCFNNHGIEIFLGRGARLQHPRLQQESLRTRHLSSLHICQQAESQYQSTTLALGALWSRTEWQVAFSEQGAQCDLQGLYLAGAQQVQDMQLNIVHGEARCTSTERFKGILHGNGRAIFNGLIKVQPDAQKTDAQLSNDNLMLSREAEVYTQPRLEIYADDVKCSHGTTVGQLDAEAIFYLRTRGIAKQEAVLMVAQGFAGEIIDTAGWVPLQDRALAYLARDLAKVSVQD